MAGEFCRTLKRKPVQRSGQIRNRPADLQKVTYSAFLVGHMCCGHHAGAHRLSVAYSDKGARASSNFCEWLFYGKLSAMS
jgi:hypothetical protein